MKNGVSSEPNALTCSGTPAARAASASPAASCAPSLARCLYSFGDSSLERPQPGRHRQRIARQRACLIDRSRRRDQLHQIGAAAVGADRQPAADDLAEARQVRPDAEDLLRAAGRGAEPGNHLVEDQQRSVRDRRASRSPARKPSRGGTTPMLPAIGSTMIAAI